MPAPMSDFTFSELTDGRFELAGAMSFETAPQVASFFLPLLGEFFGVLVVRHSP